MMGNLYLFGKVYHGGESGHGRRLNFFMLSTPCDSCGNATFCPSSQCRLISRLKKFEKIGYFRHGMEEFANFYRKINCTELQAKVCGPTMRLKLRLHFPKEHMVPIHYNEILQAGIYSAMEPDLAKFIHDQGIAYNERIFRLFTFSRLLGRYELSKDRRWIRFHEGCDLIVSSPLDEVLRSVASTLLKRPTMNIGFNLVSLTSIEAIMVSPVGSRVTVRVLSPIVAYSTLKRFDGRKYTLYREPRETEFSELVHQNLIRKAGALALWRGQPEGEHSEFRMVAKNTRQHVLKYKDFIIKGSSGVFKMYGDAKLLSLGIESGFGSKNSQGFGCVEIIS